MKHLLEKLQFVSVNCNMIVGQSIMNDMVLDEALLIEVGKGSGAGRARRDVLILSSGDNHGVDHYDCKPSIAKLPSRCLRQELLLLRFSKQPYSLSMCGWLPMSKVKISFLLSASYSASYDHLK